MVREKIMPKANHGGATAAGMEGIVEHGAPLADGRVLSELDPERNLDGSLIEGEHPDREEVDEPRETTPLSDPRPLPDEPAKRDDRGEDEEADTGKLEPVYSSSSKEQANPKAAARGQKR
jgi:hypothetical protein